MNELKAYPNVKKKRIVPILPLRSIGAVLLLLFLIPYVISGIFGNVGIDEPISPLLSEGSIYVENKTKTGVEKIPLEVYVANKLARVIPEEYEEEALKAQAVLLRTGLMQELSQTASGKSKTIYTEDEGYGRIAVKEGFWEAVAATQGICITWQGEYIKASYFAVSNGATRNAEEVIESGDHPYLQSVLCSRDFLAPDYMSKVTVGRMEFKSYWEKAAGEILEEDFTVEDFELERDSVGYVLAVKHEKALSGEAFRELFGLASSCFQIEESNGKIALSVKGVGHGLGMSQYAASELAKEGADYTEILEHFFYEIEMTKFE